MIGVDNLEVSFNQNDNQNNEIIRYHRRTQNRRRF